MSTGDLAVSLTLKLNDQGSGPAQRALKVVERGLKEVETAAKSSGAAAISAFKKLADAREVLGVRAEKTIQNEIRQTEAAYKRLAASGTASARELARAQDAMRAKVAGLRAEMEGAAKAGIGLGRGLQTAGAVAAAVVGGGLARKGVTGSVNMEKAMLQVKANIMSGVSGPEELNSQLDEVRTTSRDISRKTVFSDADVATLVGQLLKSGVKLKDAKGPGGAAYATAALAQLGGIAPEQAAAQVGSLGNAFSFKSPAQYKALADQIIRVDDASAMKSSDILYNAQLVSASAAQLKIDPKRMVSALGYLDPLGNMAGTSLNRFLEGLAGTTKGKRAALKESGLNYWQTNSDGTETLKDFGAVIEMTRQKFRGMKSDKEKIALGHKLFGEEGGRAAAFFSSKDQSFADFEASVEKSASASDKLDVAMEGLGASFTRLSNTVMATFESVSGPLRDGATAMLNTLEKYPAFTTSIVAATAALSVLAGISTVKTLLPGAGGAPGTAGKVVETAGKIVNGAKPVVAAGGAAVLPLAAMYGVSEWAGDTSNDGKRTEALTGLSGFLRGFFGDPTDKSTKAYFAKRGELDGSAESKPIVIENKLVLDGKVVAESVNRINSRDASRR